MDLRVKKTRKSIFDAFIALRAKKPLEKITVKELADEAMINKATFYLHFNDIYHLSDEIENELIHSKIEKISQLNDTLSSPYDITKAFFDVFSEEKI
ncbi:TetR/AcrR family transcriptional regulator [Cellulosilyticum ruminicola]|uniref:TetR/AcrR family transcriptional regulator n=1 Tax=Cellulosilyticum ruminicola TaxID=425254 RepID=UPI0006D0A776|nr:TetR/AcrR family transcriptional regulator [Cellulosilyticum ruminicola]